MSSYPRDGLSAQLEARGRRPSGRCTTVPGPANSPATWPGLASRPWSAATAGRAPGTDDRWLRPTVRGHRPGGHGQTIARLVRGHRVHGHRVPGHRVRGHRIHGRRLPGRSRPDRPRSGSPAGRLVPSRDRRPTPGRAGLETAGSTTGGSDGAARAQQPNPGADGFPSIGFPVPLTNAGAGPYCPRCSAMSAGVSTSATRSGSSTVGLGVKCRGGQVHHSCPWSCPHARNAPVLGLDSRR